MSEIRPTAAELAAAPVRGGTFAQLLGMGVLFTGNRRPPRPLYGPESFFSPEGEPLPEAQVERMLVERALLVLHEAARVELRGIPEATCGPYAGRTPAEILAAADEARLATFLAVVRAHRRAYHGTPWLTGAYLAWAIQGAPSLAELADPFALAEGLAAD